MAYEVERESLQHENVELARAEGQRNTIAGHHVEITANFAVKSKVDKVSLKTFLAAQLPRHVVQSA